MTNGESDNLNSGEARQPRVRRYSITHVTDYVYSSESSLCHNQLHLRPRELSYQRTLHSQVEVTPPPDYRVKGIDAFGNLTEFYSIERIHASMRVVSKCEVERESVSFASQGGAGLGLPQGLPVTDLRDWIAGVEGFGGATGSVGNRDLEAMEYLYPSRYCQPHEDFRKFVEPIWDPQVDSLQFALALNRRIYEELSYTPSATQVSTPPRVSLEKRQGVCQDFAHVMISCFRTMGLAARYVRVYQLTGKRRRPTDFPGMILLWMGGIGKLRINTGSGRIRSHAKRIQHWILLVGNVGLLGIFLGKCAAIRGQCARGDFGGPGGGLRSIKFS